VLHQNTCCCHSECIALKLRFILTHLSFWYTPSHFHVCLLSTKLTIAIWTRNTSVCVFFMHTHALWVSVFNRVYLSPSAPTFKYVHAHQLIQHDHGGHEFCMQRCHVDNLVVYSHSGDTYKSMHPSSLRVEPYEAKCNKCVGEWN